METKSFNSHLFPLGISKHVIVLNQKLLGNAEADCVQSETDLGNVSEY